MTWTKFFDGIFLINLPKRTQRFMNAAEELERYEIPFTTVRATSAGPTHTAEYALFLTLKHLFSYCKVKAYKRILVFEDDINFVENPNNYMPTVLRQLDGYSWD